MLSKSAATIQKIDTWHHGGQSFYRLHWRSDHDWWRLVVAETISFVICFTSVISQLLGFSLLSHLIHQHMDFQLFSALSLFPSIRGSPFLCSLPRNLPAAFCLCSLSAFIIFCYGCLFLFLPHIFLHLFSLMNR